MIIPDFLLSLMVFLVLLLSRTKYYTLFPTLFLRDTVVHSLSIFISTFTSIAILPNPDFAQLQPDDIFAGKRINV